MDKDSLHTKRKYYISKKGKNQITDQVNKTSENTVNYKK